MQETNTLDALAPYSALRAELENIKAANAGLAFDYTKPKGIAAAKSHIHKLRGVKGSIERTRKEAKADALEYGRKVDAAAKELTAEVESMIDVHEAPIRAMEEREAARKAKHEAAMLALQHPDVLPAGAADIKTIMERIAVTPISEAWEEYEAPARKLRDTTLESLAGVYQQAVKREAEAAELARLRKEAEDRERAEREARIAAEAAERAKRAAEEAAERQRKADADKAMEDARRKEREAQAAIEAERKKAADAEAEAARVKRAAEQAEQKRKDDEARKAVEDAKRAADKAHRARVIADIAKALAEYGDESQMAEAIANGDIPHVAVKF